MHLSPNDTNQYRSLTLNNQLRVLLISAQHNSKSAAALAVQVGHFDDPNQREGLAHYLEHMLFLGTEKYPNTNGFQHFIHQHGGQNNAWTGTEHTNFFFDILADHFDAALDRFSQFFISPLFNADALDKERKAVDSEFQLKLNDELRRLYSVYKTQINPAHPQSKFSVGNLKTLEDRDNSTSIRDEMMDFYRHHYSADLMTLVVMDKRPLDQLQSLVETYFSAIKNHTLAPKSIIPPLYLTTQKQENNGSLSQQKKQYAPLHGKGIVVYIEPLKLLRKLILIFSFPNMDAFYNSKPLTYFAHLLGDESEGSLTLNLKNRGWITTLNAGGGISGGNYREFTINCTLTELGILHRDDIVQSVFQYIRLIQKQGIEQWRFMEKQAVLEAAFRFKEPSKPLDLVSHLVMNMQRFPLSDVIYADYRMSEFDDSHLRALCAHFIPANLTVLLLAKRFKYHNTTKWYNTPYSVEPFNSKQLNTWQSPQLLTTERLFPLALPPKNHFICYQLDPQPLESVEANTLNHNEPCILEDLPGFRLWHLQDRQFRLPKGLIYIALNSANAVSSIQHIVSTHLWLELLVDSLAKKTYQAEIAGMSYQFYTHQQGITLTLSGFSQKQPQLLEMIVKQFQQHRFSQSQFKLVKAQLLRRWQNATKNPPISQLLNYMKGLLLPNTPSYDVLAAQLESITFDNLMPYIDNTLNQLQIEMLVYGDWQSQQALDLANILKKSLWTKNAYPQLSPPPFIQLGNQGTFQQAVNCDQADSAIVVYYQSTDISPTAIAIYALANQLMSSTFYHELRTKQQLGYMVGTTNFPLNQHPGIAFYIQSPNSAPSQLLNAIDDFLNAFYLFLLELNEQQWLDSKAGLAKQIAIPDRTLQARGQRLWNAIINEEADFDHKDKIIIALTEISKKEMIRFIVETLKPLKANRLVMHTQGNQHLDYPPLSVGSSIYSIQGQQLHSKAEMQ